MAPNLLKQLHDIHLPVPIGWWPLAPGWYLVLALVLCGIGFAGRYLYKKQQRRRFYQRILQTYHQQTTLASAMVLLKRVATYTYPQENIAALQGQAWLNFLMRTAKTFQLSTAEQKSLLDAPYQKNVNDESALLKRLETWLEQQR
jgi:hypothetical protein